MQDKDSLLDEKTVAGGATKNDSTIIHTIRPPRSRLRRTVLPTAPTPTSITALYRRLPTNIARESFSTLNLTDLYPLSRNLVAVNIGEALIQSFQEREEEMDIMERRKKSRSFTNNNNSTNNNFLLSPAPSRLLKRPSPLVAGFDEPPPQKKIRKKKKELKKKKEFKQKKGFKLDDPPEKERDVEWLCYTGSESETKSPDHDRLRYGLASSKVNLQAGEKPSSQVSTKSGSEIMMQHMALYFTFLKWTGRMPFVMEKDGNLTKFSVHHKSWNYIAFCFTTVIMTLVTVIMLSNFATIHKQPTTRIYMKIEHLEFDKYKEFALFTFLNLFYTVLCSLNMIFDSSIAISQYCSKWNRTCNNLHYNTAFKLKYITKREAIFWAVYAGLLIIALILDRIFADWNGAFGFISLLLFRQWIPKFRFKEAYVWLRWLGLFIHLYSLIASRLLTNMVILYCRALESMSRTYNLRLACAFGLVGKVVKEGKAVVLRRRMPFKKLFADHLLITDFSREIGGVFSLMLTTFISTKVITMVVSAYYLLLIKEGEVSNDESKLAVAANKSLIPVKDFLSLGAAMFIISVIAGFSWIEFWYTLECVHDAGESIMHALGYVTRRGLLLCKTSMERRFVLSIQGSFNPKNEYYICSINRQYIFGIIAVLFSLSVSLDGFYRQRLPSKHILECDSGGVCRKASYNPALPQIGHDIVIPKDWKEQKTNRTPTIKLDGKMMALLDDEPRTEATPSPSPIITTLKPNNRAGKFIENHMFECEGINGGRILQLKKIYSYNASERQDKVGFNTNLSYDLSKKDDWCEQGTKPFGGPSFWNDLNSKGIMQIQASNDTDWTLLCYRWVQVPQGSETDDCGNRAVKLPNKRTDELVRPDLQLTAIKVGSKYLFYCCFEWEGYETQCGLSKRSADTTPEAKENYVKGRCNGVPGKASREQDESCEDKSLKYITVNKCRPRLCLPLLCKIS